MPNNSQIHLPSWQTQKDIHACYCQDMQLQGMCEDEVSGINIFYEVWSEHFSHVVIAEVCACACYLARLHTCIATHILQLLFPF